MSLYQWVSIIIMVCASIFGGVYFTKFKNIIRQIRELIDVFDDALQDDKITKEEWQKIGKEAVDVLKVFAKK